MFKRKDEDGPSAHPPITTKCCQPAPGFCVARNRNSEPQDTMPSTSSTTMHMQQWLCPGFHAAHSQEQENVTPCTSSLTTNSHITTLILAANRRLKAKHKDRSHNPSVANPTSIAMTSADDATPHGYEVNSILSTAPLIPARFRGFQPESDARLGHHDSIPSNSVSIPSG